MSGERSFVLQRRRRITAEAQREVRPTVLLPARRRPPVRPGFSATTIHSEERRSRPGEEKTADGAAWIVIRIVRDDWPQGWLWLGVVCGEVVGARRPGRVHTHYLLVQTRKGS
jgi:hypothetical protein